MKMMSLLRNMKMAAFCAPFALILAMPSSLTASGTKQSSEVLNEVRVEVTERFRKGVFKRERTLYVRRGLKVGVFASGLGRARFMAVGPDGFIYLSVPAEGRVLVLPDRDGDGVADEVRTFASGLESPHGLSFRGDGLIVANTDGLALLKDEDGDLEADFRKTVTKDVPGGVGHWTRTVVEGPDGALYVSAGSTCNVCIEDDPRRAAVLMFPPEGGRGVVYARGLRNSVGIAFHPDTGELWGVDNGRDMLGDDLPPEELNRIVGGGDYGWPYCYGEMVPDPDYGTAERCSKTRAPDVKMQAHSAPLGISFGRGLEKFPDDLKEVLFIAFHGSWNRTVPTGYKLVAVPFKDGRPAGGPIDVITGWLIKNGSAWGRPVMPLVGPDGALYLSDDRAGAVYRVVGE